MEEEEEAQDYFHVVSGMSAQVKLQRESSGFMGVVETSEQLFGLIFD